MALLARWPCSAAAMAGGFAGRRARAAPQRSVVAEILERVCERVKRRLQARQQREASGRGGTAGRSLFTAHPGGPGALARIGYHGMAGGAGGRAPGLRQGGDRAATTYAHADGKPDGPGATMWMAAGYARCASDSLSRPISMPTIDNAM